MALDKTEMANAIVEKMGELSDDSTPVEAMGKFSDACQEYLEGNTEITFSWAGIGPPPASTPDPVTSYEAEIAWTVFPLVNPAGTTPEQALSLFSVNIEAVLITGIVTPALSADGVLIVPPFVTTPTVLLGTGSSINLTTSEKESQQDAMEAICDQIIGDITTGIKSMINPTPVTGTHGTYSGSGVMTLIQ